MSEDGRDRDALRELLRVVRERDLDPMGVGEEIVRQVQAHPDWTIEQVVAAIVSGTAPTN